MAKKILYVMVISLMVLTGCSVEVVSDDEVKKEKTFKDKQTYLLNFINKDIEKIANHETKANLALGTVAGANFRSDKELHEMLTNTVLPEYEKAVQATKELDVEMKELEPLVKLLKDSISTYYEGLLLEKEALEKRDMNILEESNAKAEEYFVIINQYHDGMKKLAKKYKIDYEPSFFNKGQ
ncbi:hypothetical protein ACFQPF_12935 [Fictibacillus iocasae]|uniref:Lipoprotein n=1 Tax=Fictibacillus iocasae TaxID=2715437 RepID=A0ABW2NQ36_9BACL